MIRSIAILVHEKHPHPLRMRYQIWDYAEHWRAMGIRVDVVAGTSKPVDADLLIPNLDLSYIPDDYWELIQKHPRVLNRNVRDIRKRVYSTHLVTPGDGYTGPVIVKTNLNSAGFPEQKILGKRVNLEEDPRIDDLLAAAALQTGGPSLRTVLLDAFAGNYPVFASVDEVPPEVFEIPDLVVQRLLGDKTEDRHVLRLWIFLGDRSRVSRLESSLPTVRGWTCSVRATEASVPDAIVALRRRLGLDYGKLDFVIHGGEAIVLDVNVSPTFTSDASLPPLEQRREFARGILSISDCGLRIAD